MTYRLEIEKVDDLPICAICGQVGKLFMFVGWDTAIAFCSPQCEQEYQFTGKYFQSSVVVNKKDGLIWLSQLVGISVLLACIGTGVYFSSGLTLPWMSETYQKLLLLFSS